MKKKQNDMDLLWKLARNELSEAEEKRAKALMKSDPELRRFFEMLTGLIDLKQRYHQDSLVNAALELSSRMIDTYRGKRVAAGPVGVCVYDSAVLPTPAEVRPADVDTRHLKYRIGDLELVLALYPISPEAYEVMGQLTGPDDGEEISVDLTAGRKTTHTELDGYRLFRFERVTAGSYRMLLRAGDKKIGEVYLEL